MLISLKPHNRFFAGRKGQANHKYSFNPSPIVSVLANGLEAPQGSPRACYGKQQQKYQSRH